MGRSVLQGGGRGGASHPDPPGPAPTSLTFNKAQFPAARGAPSVGAGDVTPPRPPPPMRSPEDAAASANPDDSAVGGGSGLSPPHRSFTEWRWPGDNLHRLFPARAGHELPLRERDGGARASSVKHAAGWGGAWRHVRAHFRPVPGPAQRRHLEVGQALGVAEPRPT